MNKRLVLFIVLVLLVVSTILAQEKVDTATIAKIRTEGLEHSQVMEVFGHLVNVIGPRLTASPAYKTAVDWCREKLANMGFDNVHVEPWEFGRGWELQKLTVEMIEPRYQPLIGYAKGWSPATAGVIVASPVWLGNPKDDPKKYEGKLSGAIVMTRPIPTDFIRADQAPASRQAYRRRTAVSISFTDELSRFIQSIENVENFADSCPFPKKEHSFGGVDECQCAVRPEYRGVGADHFPAAA